MGKYNVGLVQCVYDDNDDFIWSDGWWKPLGIEIDTFNGDRVQCAVNKHT